MKKNKTYRKWYSKHFPRKFAEKMAEEVEQEFQKIFKSKPSPERLYKAQFDRDYELRAVWDDEGIYRSNKIIRKAKKYYIPLSTRMPIPESEDPIGEDWVLSVYSYCYLSDNAMYDLKIKIREELKWKQEILMRFSSILIGILGLLVALFSQV